MKKIFSTAALLISLAMCTYSQWIEQTSGINTPLTNVSAIDNNNAWICGYSGKVLRTTNGGTNWITVNNPSAYHNFFIFGIDANTALVSYYNNNIPANFLMRTTNGGTNWTQVFTQIAQNNGGIEGIWMSSATNGFLLCDPVGGRWSLWKTTNGGVNWDSTGMFLAAQGNLYCSSGLFASGSNYYFGTNTGIIYYSSNSGLNWVTQIIPGNNNVYSIWFNNSATGLCGSDTAVCKTTNNGTWVVTPMPGEDIVTGITGDGTNTWMTRYAGIIYKSTNNGTTWTADYSNPSNNPYMFIGKARTGNRMWAVTYSGSISKNDGLVGVTQLSNQTPLSFNLEQNFPNPFNPSTTICFSIPAAQLVNIKIYDVPGNEVMTVVNGNMQQGTYSVIINMSNIPSGIYFYKLSAGDYFETKKMILVK